MDIKTLAQAQDRITELEGLLATANASLEASTKELATAKAGSEELTKLNAELGSKVTDLEAQVGTLNGTVKEQAEQIKQLQAEAKTSDLKAAAILAEVGQPPVAVDLTKNLTSEAKSQYESWAKKYNKK
jgi:chromosome segregation ATPase